MSFELHLALPGEHGTAAFLRVAGVSVLSRLLIGAHRHGARTTYLSGTSAALTRARTLLRSDARTWDLDVRYGEIPRAALPVVEGIADSILSHSVWSALHSATGPVSVPGVSFCRVIDGAEPCESLWQGSPTRGTYAMRVHDAASARAAKRVIFANLRKSSSRFIAREVYSRLSVPMSRLLAETSITPNRITILHFSLGIFGTLLMATGSVGLLALGGLLLQLSAVYDLCDGEIARSKYLESEGGQYLDSVCDHITHVFTVLGLTLGYANYSAAADLPWAGVVLPLGLAGAAVLGLLVAWLFWYAKKNELGGVLTAIAKSYESNIERREMGALLRVLHFVRPLGERDQFTLLIFVLSILPWLTGHALAFHVLFWGVMSFVVLATLYFGLGAVKAAHSQHAEVY